jgi:hypothetical protein
VRNRSPCRSRRRNPARPLSDADVAQIRAFMSDPPFNEGTWGIRATDLETGRELFSLNADKLFHTASTTKNFTTAAALDGRLILRVSGDLTMRGRALPDGDVAYAGFDHTDANEVPGAAVLTPQEPLAGLSAPAERARRDGIRSVRDVANHIPFLGPDGNYGDGREVLAAAFTRFENHEGISSLPYTSQRKG